MMMNGQKNRIYFLCLTWLVISSCQTKIAPDLLLSADETTRTQALAHFEKLSDERKAELIPVLVDSLDDADPLLALRASAALKLAGPQAAPQVKKMLGSLDPFVRLCATEVLAALAKQDLSLVADLEKLTRDPHPLVKEEASMALEKLAVRPTAS